VGGVYTVHIYWMGLANFLLSESLNGIFIRITVSYETLSVDYGGGRFSEIPGYMMSHPRTADLPVMPLVILLKN